MSRNVIQTALSSGNALASIVEQSLNALGVSDPAEHQRTTDMLRVGIDYFDNGARGHALDAWLGEFDTLDDAITFIADQYRATPEDIEAFIGAIDDTGQIVHGESTLDDLYPENPDDDATGVRENADQPVDELGATPVPAADHRSDLNDPRWKMPEQSGQRIKEASLTNRAGWSEPVMLDKDGKAMNAPAAPPALANGLMDSATASPPEADAFEAEGGSNEGAYSYDKVE